MIIAGRRDVSASRDYGTTWEIIYRASQEIIDAKVSRSGVAIILTFSRLYSVNVETKTVEEIPIPSMYGNAYQSLDISEDASTIAIMSQSRLITYRNGMWAMAHSDFEAFGMYGRVSLSADGERAAFMWQDHLMYISSYNATPTKLPYAGSFTQDIAISRDGRTILTPDKKYVVGGSGWVGIIPNASRLTNVATDGQATNITAWRVGYFNLYISNDGGLTATKRGYNIESIAMSTDAKYMLFSRAQYNVGLLVNDIFFRSPTYPTHGLSFDKKPIISVSR